MVEGRHGVVEGVPGVVVGEHGRLGRSGGEHTLDPLDGLGRDVRVGETEVMQAGVAEGALCLSGLVIFELEDREIYVAVAQVAALRGRGIDLSDLF